MKSTVHKNAKMNTFTACFSKIAGFSPTLMKVGSDVIMQKSARDVKSTKYECGRNSSGWRKGYIYSDSYQTVGHMKQINASETENKTFV